MYCFIVWWNEKKKKQEIQYIQINFRRTTILRYSRTIQVKLELEATYESFGDPRYFAANQRRHLTTTLDTHKRPKGCVECDGRASSLSHLILFLSFFFIPIFFFLFLFHLSFNNILATPELVLGHLKHRVFYQNLKTKKDKVRNFVYL